MEGSPVARLPEGDARLISAFAQMVSEQIGEPVLAQAHAHEALKDVEIGIAVTLDQNRSILKNRDVPADDNAVVELAVRRDREVLNLFPERNDPALDQSSAVRVDREPAKASVRPEIARF